MLYAKMIEIESENAEEIYRQLITFTSTYDSSTYKWEELYFQSAKMLDDLVSK